MLAGLFGGRIGAQTSTLYTVEQNGTRAQSINIVFLSEGYTAAELPNFATHVNNAVSFLFSKEPWQQYRSYCNIYRIEIASNQSGCDNGNTSGSGGTRDTYFNAGFNTPSVVQLLTLAGDGASRAYALLNTHVPEYDVPVVIVNDTKYGGAGGTLSVASVNGSSAAVVEHEIGHSFAQLADEYDVEYAIYTPAEKPNNTAQTTRSGIRWNYWIDSTTSIPTPETLANDSLVGLFEGSMYRTVGWYRPHNNSLMRSLNRPCGQVNREQFVLQFYSRVSPINGFAPSATSRTVTAYENLAFQLTPKVPSSGIALVASWKIDGVLKAGAASTSLNLNSETLGNGVHKVTGILRDPTPFVRRDAAGLLEDEVTWTLSLSNQLAPTLGAWRASYGTDAANPTHDGLKNLVKYALGIDPSRIAAPEQYPTASVTGGGSSKYLQLTVPRRNRRADINYIVEVSDDLKTWRSGSGHTMTVLDQETQLVVVDIVPVGATPKRFLRLKVAVK